MQAASSDAGRVIRSTKLSARVGLLAALLALATAATAQGGQGSAFQPPDPARNIPIDYTALPPACDAAPSGAACETYAVAQLDHSRAVMGLPAYPLPRNFLHLPPGAQLLMLTNLDRASYKIPPVAGLNLTLDGVAGSAASAGQDPAPPSGFFANLQEAGWASNWAGGMPDILFAYDAWMYDDGYGTGNIACPTRGSDGCWGHRHDVFSFPTLTTTAMGVAVARFNGQPSFTQLIVATFPQPEPAAQLAYTLTWSALSRHSA